MERPCALEMGAKSPCREGSTWCWGRLRGRMPTVAASLKGHFMPWVSPEWLPEWQGPVRSLFHIHTHRPGLVRGRGQWEGLLRMRDAHSRVTAEPQPAAVLPGGCHSPGDEHNSKRTSWAITTPPTLLSLYRSALHLTVVHATGRKPM